MSDPLEAHGRQEVRALDITDVYASDSICVPMSSDRGHRSTRHSRLPSDSGRGHILTGYINLPISLLPVQMTSRIA